MPATIPAGTSTSSVLTAAQFTAVNLYTPRGGLTDTRGGPSVGRVDPGGGNPPAGTGQARFTFVARVLVSVPLPYSVSFGGKNYGWSENDGAWVEYTPYPAVLAAASVPAGSPLAGPIF